MNLEGESLEDYHRLKELILRLVFDRADELTSKKIFNTNGSFWFYYEFTRPDVAIEVSKFLSGRGIVLEQPLPEEAPWVCRFRVSDLISSAVSIAFWSIENKKTIHEKWIPVPNIDPDSISMGNRIYSEIVESLD